MPINKVKKADPITAVFVIKDVKKNRNYQPKYFGLELLHKVKKAEPALNNDEMVNGVIMLFPTHKDISYTCYSQQT